MRLFLLILFTQSAFVFVFGQQAVKPGCPSIRYNLNVPSVTYYKLITIDSTGKVLSVTKSENRIHIDLLKKTMVRIQKRELGPGRILIDSSFADLTTLAPIRMSMVTSPHFMSMNLKFEDTKVIAKVDKEGKMTNVDHDATIRSVDPGLLSGLQNCQGTKENYQYFDSNLLDCIVGLLPYRAGYSAIVSTYTFERKGVDPYHLQYIGEDILFLANEPIVCGVVDVKPMAALGKKNVPAYRYWIDKSTGRIVKFLVPGPNKTYFVMTLDSIG